MKTMRMRIIMYASIVLLLLILTGRWIVNRSIIRIQLPHGALLHVLPADKDNQVRGAVILCPGGGYRYLQLWTEGYLWFPFFHRQGYTVAMLEYRFPHQYPEREQIMLDDGTDGMLVMRQHAQEWNFDKDNVGMMGFSAGGHLASYFMVSDKASVRPDFGILFYPVVSMKKELTHKRTHDSLLGEDASKKKEEQFSNELHISEHTPPAYIVMITGDTVVNPQNAKLFYDGMRAKNRPATLQVYHEDSHGWGLQPFFTFHSQVMEDLKNWLDSRQQVKRNEE